MTARSTSPRPHGRKTAEPKGPEHSASTPSEPRPRRRGRSRSKAAASTPLTSLPTGRRAYTDTREWLLDRHGPYCAYCGLKQDPTSITLDHVTPRRGQTAYDRRDNLVLACQRCNGNKADTSIMAFLLARRERAATLLRYGLHLSPMLVKMAREIAGEDAYARAERLSDPDYPYAD